MPTPTTLVVKPPTADLNVIAFDRFVPLLYQCAGRAEHITIDLRGLGFIDLFSAACILHCCADIIERHGCRIRLELSEDGGCNFLPHLGFLDVLPPGIEVSNTFGPARLQLEAAMRGEDAKFLEITPLTSEDVVDEVLLKLSHVLRRNLRYPKSVALAMVSAFSEVCTNVTDHNPDGAPGFAAMQICRGREGRYLQFVVADRGPGIRTTLSRNPDYAHLASDLDAIEASTLLGASEFGSSGMRGNGLYQLRSMVDNHHGSVHIRSGGGRLYWNEPGRDPYRIGVPHMPGVQVAIRFPAKTKENRGD